MIEYLLRIAQLNSMNCKPQWRKPKTISHREGAELPMHAENIEAMKREVLRLLDGTVGVLKCITDTTDLLRESDPEQRRQLDAQKAAKWQEAVSKILAEQDEETAEVDEAQIVGGMIVIADDQAPEVA